MFEGVWGGQVGFMGAWGVLWGAGVGGGGATGSSPNVDTLYGKLVTYNVGSQTWVHSSSL